MSQFAEGIIWLAGAGLFAITVIGVLALCELLFWVVTGKSLIKVIDEFLLRG